MEVVVDSFLIIKTSIAGPWCMLLSLYLSFVFLIGNEQAIAMHTFCVLILRWRGPEYISKVVVLMIWGFTALVIAIPYCFHRNEKYYGDAGFCKSCIFLAVAYFLTNLTFKGASSDRSSRRSGISLSPWGYGRLHP